MSYGAKRTNSLRDFRLARDQVEHLETASNLCASRRQGIHHFFYFDYDKTLSPPRETVIFCFPSDCLGETKLTFSLEASHLISVMSSGQ